jgi:hypothetical protein
MARAVPLALGSCWLSLPDLSWKVGAELLPVADHLPQQVADAEVQRAGLLERVAPASPGRRSGDAGPGGELAPTAAVPSVELLTTTTMRTGRSVCPATESRVAVRSASSLRTGTSTAGRPAPAADGNELVAENSGIGRDGSHGVAPSVRGSGPGLPPVQAPRVGGLRRSARPSGVVRDWDQAPMMFPARGPWPAALAAAEVSAQRSFST